MLSILQGAITIGMIAGMPFSEIGISNPKNTQSTHFLIRNNGLLFGSFAGQLSHAFSCKHETYDL